MNSSRVVADYLSVSGSKPLPSSIVRDDEAALVASAKAGDAARV